MGPESEFYLQQVADMLTYILPFIYLFLLLNI